VETPATADDVRSALAELANPADAVGLRRYFKTGPGEYGEGDQFIGVRVPALRVVAKRFRGLSFGEIDALLNDAIHEHRLVGLLLLVAAARADPDGVRRYYLAAVQRGRVNNWDLVDLSAPEALGDGLIGGDLSVLDELSTSESLWERRVAVLATFAFLRRGDPTPTLAIAERLLGDREDLIHKAVGWMLRELGKRVSRDTLVGFLDAHAAQMPRTMLSYATEHFTPEERMRYRSLR
jgi:3-methyladenine DNA glycosylase AlkD